MNAISILIALLAFILMIVGLIPLLGWLNWIVLAVCVVGIIFGAVSRDDKRAGLVINIAIGIVAVLRLTLGGGLV